MRIRRTDLEILAGSGETLTYRKWTRTYDDEGNLSPRVRAYFDNDDLIIMTVTLNGVVVMTKIATIVDGNACITLLGHDTTTLTDGIYIYDIKCFHSTDEPYFIVAPSNFEIVWTSETESVGS